ncbi:MAG: hypothetical protein QXL94_05665, partial [Candidatus Parvarchaeum sp.]
MSYKVKTIDNLCKRVQLKGDTFYVCKSPFEEVYFVDYDLKKAHKKVLKDIEKFEVIKSGTNRFIFNSDDDEEKHTNEDKFDKYYDEAMSAVVNQNSELGRDDFGSYLKSVCPMCGKAFISYVDSPVSATKQLVIHIENIPSHIDAMEKLAIAIKEELNENTTKASYKNDNKKLSKGEIHRALFPLEDNEVDYEEPLDKYYDSVLLSVIEDSSEVRETRLGEIGVSICPFCKKVFTSFPETRLSATNQLVLHIENTPSHVEAIEKLAINMMNKSEAKTEKANYENGENPYESYYSYYRKPEMTSQTLPNIDEANGGLEADNLREKKRRENRDDDYYVAHERTAESHDFSGKPDMRRRSGHSKHYLTQK